ncbi:hypothetical protein LMG28614_05756 [Paraburkholderia ultramafica]|uniref:Uncharacterized protein n=1 Tax=Paraburkholderia ultramafica TaxID=1544867 RepID=A0A6S7DEE1_9BURK|nr:hypothetical protein LMG28614_05756 [Paraburkholderia ultramafica]
MNVVGKRRGESSCADGGPRRGVDCALTRSGACVRVRIRVAVRSRSLTCLLYYLPTTVADWITIGVFGTSLIGPRVVVGVASIFFTTSMPLVTLPNTA